MTLSTLLRGSIYEKLRWTFKLYDLNGDGCITRSELGQIVLAIHELMGKRPQVSWATPVPVRLEPTTTAKASVFANSGRIESSTVIRHIPATSIRRRWNRWFSKGPG